MSKSTIVFVHLDSMTDWEADKEEKSLCVGGAVANKRAEEQGFVSRKEGKSV